MFYCLKLQVRHCHCFHLLFAALAVLFFSAGSYGEEAEPGPKNEKTNEDLINKNVSPGEDIKDPKSEDQLVADLIYLDEIGIKYHCRKYNDFSLIALPKELENETIIEIMFSEGEKTPAKNDEQLPGYNTIPQKQITTKLQALAKVKSILNIYLFGYVVDQKFFNELGKIRQIQSLFMDKCSLAQQDYSIKINSTSLGLSLFLSRCSTDDGWQNFFGKLENMGRFDALYLWGMIMNPDEWNSVFNEKYKIRILEIYGGNISVQAFDGMNKLSKLEHVKLSRITIKNCSFLNNLENLKTLQVIECEIPDLDQTFIKSIPRIDYVRIVKDFAVVHEASADPKTPVSDANSKETTENANGKIKKESIDSKLE